MSAVSCRIFIINSFCDQTILPNKNFNEKKNIISVPCRIALYVLTCMVTRQYYQMKILVKKKLSAVSRRIISIDMYGNHTILPNDHFTEKKKIRAVSRNIVDIDMYCDHTILPNENFSEKKIIRAVSCRIIPIDMYGDQTILPNANFIEKKN